MEVAEERSRARPRTESDAVLRGRQVGDFVLRECIGEGAFAAVYRSDQPLLGREAVVKVLHLRLRSDEVMFQRFMREARLASRLDHPYAAHIYAFGIEDDGLAWIAMELVHGTSLERWIAERGPLPLEMLVGFFEQVAEIVQNAHDHGIIHRDLKPSNVMMVEYAGKIFPKLLDFGIAKLVDDVAQREAAMPEGSISGDDEPPVDLAAGSIKEDSSVLGLGEPDGLGSDVHLTQANATLGSPPYMSPEQWSDAPSVGPRSDLYSLGVMAYEALTGRQPFTGPTIAAIGEQHCNADVPPIGAGLPSGLDRVFQRALAKLPGERPVSALAFARELRGAAFPRPSQVAATLQTRALSEPAFPGRRRWSPIAIGAAAALVIGSGAALAVIATRAPASAASAASEPPVIAAKPAGAPEATTEAAPAARAEPAPPSEEAAPPPAAAPRPAATVHVEIVSTPPGAQVFRLPSETRVGATPWRAELPSEDGAQVFLVRRPGFADRQIEVDLRTGGKRVVKLVHAARRPAPAAPPSPQPPARHRGDPVNPFPAPGAGSQ